MGLPDLAQGPPPASWGRFAGREAGFAPTWLPGRLSLKLLACVRGPSGSPTRPSAWTDQTAAWTGLHASAGASLLAPPHRLPADLDRRSWLVVRARYGGSRSRWKRLGCAPLGTRPPVAKAPSSRPRPSGSCQHPRPATWPALIYRSISIFFTVINHNIRYLLYTVIYQLYRSLL